MKNELRERALKILKLKNSKLSEESSEYNLTEILHELDVYTEELKLQNEELVQTEHELQELREEYFKLFEHDSSAHIVLDKNYNVVKFNQSSNDFFKFSTVPILTITIRSFIPRKNIGDFLMFIQNELLPHSSIVLDLHPYDKKNTNKFKIFKHFYTHKEENFLHLTLTNIQAEHDTLEQIKHQKELLNDFLSSSTNFIWEIDSNGKYTFVSDTVKRVLAYEPKELIGKSFFDFMREKGLQRVSTQFADIKHKASPIEDLENWKLTKSGEEVCFLTNGTPFFDEDNTLLGYRGNDINITEIKKQEEELQCAKLNAELASKSKSEFLANMSHEIRTPLNGVLGFVERLAKSEKDPSRLEQLNTIRSSGESLINIINDILDFSKIEAGKMQIEYTPIILHKAFKDTTSVFKGVASAKNVTFETIVSEDMPECVLGDMTRLKQVVFNLLSNALKFTHPGGSVILKGGYDPQKEIFRIDVIDSGVGISKENLTHIFEAFTQEDLSTTRKYGGTGLGLSISSRIISLMDGELKVESEVGEGSKFYFEIPAEACTLDKDEEQEKDDSELHFTGNVLVVEDNKTNQMLMGMILEDNALTYDMADDGAEGVLKWKQKEYDIVLMDENMPNVSGIEATRIIREQEDADSHIPIVAVTANALLEDRERFLDAGMDDYISKPYAEKDVLRVLRKYLA